MVASVIIGSTTSLIFFIALLYCVTDVNEIVTSPAGALLALLFQATGSVAGSLCLQVFPVGAMFFASQAVLTTSSRMTVSSLIAPSPLELRVPSYPYTDFICPLEQLAFARDGGLPASRFFTKVDDEGVPTHAIYLSSSLVALFGLIYLGSSSALNAILSSSVVFLNCSCESRLNTLFTSSDEQH